MCVNGVVRHALDDVLCCASFFPPEPNDQYWRLHLTQMDVPLAHAPLEKMPHPCIYVACESAISGVTLVGIFTPLVVGDASGVVRIAPYPVCIDGGMSATVILTPGTAVFKSEPCDACPWFLIRPSRIIWENTLTTLPEGLFDDLTSLSNL